MDNVGTVSRHLLGKTVKITTNPSPDRDLNIGTRIYEPEMLCTQPRCSIKKIITCEKSPCIVRLVGATSAHGSTNPSFP